MKKEQTIGSASDCDIILKGRYISESHAVLIVEDDKVYIDDLDSQFGVHVNGHKILKRTELTKKDRVKLGTQLFHWKDYVDKPKPEVNSIYMKDLFNPSGQVEWRDYKVILLLAVGAAIIIPLGVPTILFIVWQKLGLLSEDTATTSTVFRFSKSTFTWALALMAAYVFLNLTQKMVKSALKSPNNTVS